jgi:hypothetical protein
MEIYCTELLSKLFVIHPRAIPGNPSVDIETLMNSKTVERTLATLASATAREKTNGAIEDWLPFLASHCGEKLPKRVSAWPSAWRSLAWMVAQRNCIIHRGGQVDAKLRTKASHYGFPLASEQTTLELSSADVSHNVTTVLTVASRLLQGFCVAQFSNQAGEPDWNMVQQWIAYEQLEQLSRGQIAIARAICPEPRPPDPERNVDIIDIASWYVHLTQGMTPEIRAEIESSSWGTNTRWMIHRSILLSDEQSTRELVQQSVNSKAMSVIELRHESEFFLARKYLN